MALSIHTDVVLALLPAMLRSERCKLIAFGDLSRFSSAVVEALARDPSAPVRAVIARFWSGDSLLLSALSIDEDERVRQALAENINVPSRLLLELFYDPISFVREAARENRSRAAVFDALLADPKTPSDVLESVARRLYTTSDPEQEGLVCLFEPENWPIRCELLAQHPNIKRERLEELWQYGGIEAQFGLAKNPTTPEHILEAMAHSEETGLLDVLLDHPSAPVALIIELIEKKR